MPIKKLRGVTVPKVLTPGLVSEDTYARKTFPEAPPPHCKGEEHTEATQVEAILLSQDGNTENPPKKLEVEESGVKR